MHVIRYGLRAEPISLSQLKGVIKTMKISRELLKQLAMQLKAKRVGNNIYKFENEIYYIERDNTTLKHVIIAYSVGRYGNTGRIDLIEFENGKTEYYYY